MVEAAAVVVVEVEPRILARLARSRARASVCVCARAYVRRVEDERESQCARRARRKGPSFSSVPPGQGGGGGEKGRMDRAGRGSRRLAPARRRETPLRGRIGTDCRPAARDDEDGPLPRRRIVARRESIKVQEGCISRARDAYARTPTQSHAAAAAAARRRIVLPFPFHFPSSSLFPVPLSRDATNSEDVRSPPFFPLPPLTVLYTRACRATDRSH